MHGTNKGHIEQVEGGWIGVRAAWRLEGKVPWPHLVSVSSEHLKTHALLIGATGSGKTNLMHQLMARDLEQGHSFCVLDMRGDLVRAVIEMAAGHVDPRKVRLIDLREKERPFGFNPLHGRGESYFRALNVLDAVASESESWGVQLGETLRMALMLLAEAGGSLAHMEAVFHDRSFRLACIEKADSESVLAFWHRYGEMKPDRQAALAMPVLNKVSLLLATATMRRILGHPDPIDLGRHLNTQGSVLLVSLAVDELHSSGLMTGSIVLSSICREIFARVDTAESKRNPVRLYVDEFEHFGMKEFETILAEGRRFKFSLVLAHQTLAQLSPRMRSMILNNVGTKFAFRCGREDGATLSKDLTGDPKAYDFTDLPVGVAVMWRRNLGVLEVEVNEPIVGDVGEQSEHARCFLDEVYGEAGKALEVIPGGKSDKPTMATQLSASKNPIGEDWLCD